MTNQPVFELLRAEVATTQEKYSQAKENFWRVSGEPPDGGQRLELAARAQTIAMIAYTKAVHRFNEFLLSGKVPHDLRLEPGLVQQTTGFNQEQRSKMNKCVYCGTPTRMYEHDSPICMECASRLDSREKLTRKEPAAEEKTQ